MAALGDATHGLEDAERRLAAQFEADISALGVSRAAGLGSERTDLRSIAIELRGQTPAECRVLALAAYDLAARGEDSNAAAILARRALGHGYLVDDPFHSPALLAAGVALSSVDQLVIAEDVFSVAARRAQDLRSTALYALAMGLRGASRYHRGALSDAFADLTCAEHAGHGQPWEMMVWDGRGELLRIHLEQGHASRAEASLEEWGASGPLPDAAFGNRLRFARGHVHLAAGRFAAAVADLEIAGQRMEANGVGLLPEWRPPTAIAHHQLGHHETARELADAELSLALSWGSPRRLGLALTTVGLIEGGRHGVEQLRAAVEILEHSPARLQLARSQVLLGAMLRRAGQPRTARPILQEGIALAASLSADALVTEGEDELSASAASRLRRTTLSGPAALTPSERRVAALAAEGRSNPDIARTLYITRKTVEMHLMNTYRKLEITSRQQLAAALAA